MSWEKNSRGEMVPVARLCLVAQRIAQTLGLGGNESLHLCSRSLRPRSETNEVIASLVESQEMEDGVDDVMDFLHEGHVRGVFEVHWRGRSLNNWSNCELGRKSRDGRRGRWCHGFSARRPCPGSLWGSLEGSFFQSPWRHSFQQV